MHLQLLLIQKIKKTKTKSSGGNKLADMGVTVEIQQAVDVLRKAGYEVIAPKEKVNR